METRQLLDRELLYSPGSKPITLSAEAYELVETMVSDISTIFGKSLESPNKVIFQSILESHISPAPSEEWMLGPIFDAVLTDTPLVSLQSYFLKRLRTVFDKVPNWKGSYYNVIHGIYHYDELLKRTWTLPPPCLCDLSLTPNGIREELLVSTAPGKAFYTQLVSSVEYDQPEVQSGIINAARWIAILACHLRTPDQELFQKSIPGDFISSNMKETVFLRILNVIFVELWKLDIPIISYSDLVSVCQRNVSWSKFPQYLMLNDLSEELLDDENIPFEELFHIEPESSPPAASPVSSKEVQ